VQGRPGERAAETGRVVCPLVLLLDQQSLRVQSSLTTDHGPLCRVSPREVRCRGFLGRRCHVMCPGLAFPGPSPGGCPRRSGCHGPQTKPKPAPVASIQYKNGHCGTASPPLYCGIERQNARVPERQDPPGNHANCGSLTRGWRQLRGRWRADKRWTGVLDRVTALLAPKSFHSLLSFSSLPRVARPFGVVVLRCCPFLLTDQVLCPELLPESSDFSRLLLDDDSSDPPIDCPHGPPSPSISTIPPDYSSLQDQTGLLGLPFRTVVFSVAIAFLCPDALRSNNRFLPCVAAHGILLSGKYSLPHDRQSLLEFSPHRFHHLWR